MAKSKISAFFKPSPSQSDHPSPLSDSVSPSVPMSSINGGVKTGKGAKVVNKKRSYAQFHLELGQKNFLLHQCSVCGMMYARGDEGDEKLHKEYHKEYFEGIAFKGWKNERVVERFCDSSDRIVMVQDDDSSVQKQKVKQVIKTVEKELGFGEGQLLHSLCKVYLYISSHKIVGCLVAEPIKEAYKVIPNKNNNSNNSNNTNNNNNNSNNNPSDKLNQSNPSNPQNKVNKTMNFGKFNFKREVFRKSTSSLNNNNKNNKKEENSGSSAIICEEKGVFAILGFRAIWVAPAKRRKGFASKLLDSARKSFSGDEIMEICKCGFSPPTFTGKKLACNYSKTASFLVYKTDQ